MDPLTASKFRPLQPRLTTLMFTRNTASSSYSTPPPPQNLVEWNAGVATTNRPSSMKKQANTIPSRWCPTPQQVHALREMYRSGLRTPTTNQIEHIASWLARYGKIEGKNVFYWFQNHKARERQKLRHRPKHNHSFPPRQQHMTPAFLQESATAMNRRVASERSTSGNREPPRQHHHRGTTARTLPVGHSVTKSDINAMNQNEDSQTLELFPLLSNGRRRSTLIPRNVGNSDSTDSAVVPRSRGSPEINRRNSSPTQFFEFFPINN